MRGYNTGRVAVFSSRTGPRTRVGFLDEARGLCIILMVLYHGLFNVVFLFGWDFTLADGTRALHALWHLPAMRFAQPFVAGIFIFISGIACRYSRSNLKRGAIVLALGLCITGVMLLFMPDQAIYFGILHFMGSAMILFALLNRTLDKVPPSLSFLVCAFIFTLTLNVPNGFFGLSGLWTYSFPAGWTDIGWLIPLGFTAAGADHFPLLPWLFLFLAGSCLGLAFVQQDMPGFFYRNRSRFLAATGRRTIYIYILHQPVLLGLMFGIDFLLGVWR